MRGWLVLDLSEPIDIYSEWIDAMAATKSTSTNSKSNKKAAAAELSDEEWKIMKREHKEIDKS